MGWVWKSKRGERFGGNTGSSSKSLRKPLLRRSPVRCCTPGSFGGWMKKKIKKPRYNPEMFLSGAAAYLNFEGKGVIHTCDCKKYHIISLWRMKRLHSWLGKSIAYLEARDGE